MWCSVYADRDIYLLDDPLSALDVHVGQNVFQELICTGLNKKLVVLVTHDWSLLRKADQIVFVNGRTAVVGTSVDQLKETCPAFKALYAMQQIEPPVTTSSTETTSSTSSLALEDGAKDNGTVPVASATTQAEEEDASVAAVGGAGVVVVEKVAQDVSSTTTQDSTASPNNHGNSKEEAIDDDDDEDGTLTRKEYRQRGSVKCSTIVHYFNLFFSNCNSGGTMSFILLVMGCAEGFNIATNYWLALWSVSSEKGEAPPSTFPYWLGIYGLFVLGSLILYVLDDACCTTVLCNTYIHVHVVLLCVMMHVALLFYDTCVALLRSHPVPTPQKTRLYN